MSHLALPVPLTAPMRMALLLTVLPLAGCADRGTAYPSLLPRAVETRSDAEPASAVVALPLDPALDPAISAVGQRLAANAAAFAREQAIAEPVFRRAEGAVAGSNAWLDAQNALAAIDGVAAQARAILADAEHLAIARALGGLPPSPPLDEVVARAAQQTQAQGKAAALMAGALAPPAR